MLTDQRQSRPTGPRVRYQTPKLICFGAVCDLTRSGGTGPSENASSGCGAPTRKTNPQCPSDRKIKQDVVLMASHPLGIGLYLFHYKPEFRDQWGHGRQFGVMADEVEAVMPEAVCVHADGYKMVDYSMLGITRFVQ